MGLFYFGFTSLVTIFFSVYRQRMIRPLIHLDLDQEAGKQDVIKEPVAILGEKIRRNGMAASCRALEIWKWF